VEKPQAIITEVNQAEAQYLTQALETSLSVKNVPSILAEGAAESLGDTEVLIPFIHSTIGRTEMDAMPRLRLIATRSTGCDHIDLAVADEKKIAVANVPSYGENTVAEHTSGGSATHPGHHC
jgi:D-lactate dehydrogenase